MVYAHGIAILIAFSLITCLHVILGELVPKSLALQRSEQVALAVAAPMDVFLTLTRPLLFVMSRAAGSVLQGIWLAEVAPGAGALSRRIETDRDRQPPIRSDSTLPGGDGPPRARIGQHQRARGDGAAP